MNPRLKKFIGTVVMVVFVIFYALIVMALKAVGAERDLRLEAAFGAFAESLP